MKSVVMRVLAVAVVSCVFYAASTQHSAAQVAVPAATMAIGTFLNGLKDLVQQLERSASALLSQGNNSLAQQQLILAGTIQQTIDQISTAYAGALDKTFGQLNTAELNTFSDLASTVNQLTHLEGRAASDVQALVYRTQGAANQLIDRLPLTKRYPVFYGASVRDLMVDPSQSPADVELLGFAFTDPRLNLKKPSVKVANKTIAENFISVQNDRVQIQIPDNIKKEVGFSSSPCAPRQTFGIDIEVFYSGSTFFGLFHPEQTVLFHVNALAGSQLYTLAVAYTGVRTDVTQKAEPFAAQSGSVNVGCEDGGSTSVAYTLPLSATEINCTAGWINTDHLKNQDQTACAVTGQTAKAEGNIRGLDNQCIGGGLIPRICNCPGGGHGTLQIAGTYKVPQSNTANVANVPVGSYVLSHGNVTAILPSDAAVTVKSVTITVTRRGCPTVADTINIAMPPNPLQAVTQTSANGGFVSTFRQNQISIAKSE
jgi:hypothetical protein